jgi:hypothetical protein
VPCCESNICRSLTKHMSEPPGIRDLERTSVYSIQIGLETPMSSETQVAIVGAGPYGLSIAAHLQRYGIDHRIIGTPMQLWLQHMPKGMHLKSEGFASNLYDPDGHFSLRSFCSQHQIAYTDVGLPVHLGTFSNYGLAFQQQFAPHLENEKVVMLGRSHAGFEIGLSGGTSFNARRVVLSIGVGYFGHVPEKLEHLPRELLSHSSDHHDLDCFKGRDVIVVGGGSSAIDIAALLHEGGARVQLVARRPPAIHGKMRLPRPLWQRVRHPMSAIGPSWRATGFCIAPNLFRYLPEQQRLRIVKQFLGPAAGWFMEGRIKNVPQLSGYEVQYSDQCNGRVRLRLAHVDGIERQLFADHVIAATGYRVDLRRLPFLNEDIRCQLRSVEHSPVLSPHFESTVPGLYFVGPAAASSFGPVMRFAAGAKFTARRISRHLAGNAFQG